MLKTKIIIKLFVVLLLLFVYLPSQSIAAERIKIGLVNLDKAGRESKRGKEIVEQMKRRIRKEQDAIKKKEAKVRDLRNELNKQGLIMSEDLKRKKEADYRAEVRSLQRHIRDSEEEIKIKQKEATSKILKELIDVIKNIGKNENYTYITTNEFTVYYDNSIDITNQVVRTYDKTSRSRKSSKR